jgi:hypothetical protein
MTNSFTARAASSDAKIFSNVETEKKQNTRIPILYEMLFTPAHPTYFNAG